MPIRIATSESSASLSGSTVSDNHGSGIQLSGGGVSLTDSRDREQHERQRRRDQWAVGGSRRAFADQLSRGGQYRCPRRRRSASGAVLEGELHATNSPSAANRGQERGGIYLAGGSGTLTDSTVSGNIASSGGGIFNNGGSITLNGTNSFFNNVPEDCVGASPAVLARTGPRIVPYSERPRAAEKSRPPRRHKRPGARRQGVAPPRRHRCPTALPLCGSRVPRAGRGSFPWHTSPETAPLAIPRGCGRFPPVARGNLLIPCFWPALAPPGPAWPKRPGYADERT